MPTLRIVIKFWLDTVNPTDLEEVSWEFFYKKKKD